MINNAVKFSSDRVEYSTPWPLFNYFKDKYDINFDVCASTKNHKCKNYWTKEDDAFTKEWRDKVFWMNPPFSRDLKKWVEKAYNEHCQYSTTIVCLIPVRSNTVWFNKYLKNTKIYFINGEVNFNDEKRGLWLPILVAVFKLNLNPPHLPNDIDGRFDFVDYRSMRKAA